MISALRKTVQYGVTPVFLFLAVINYLMEKNGGGHQHGGTMKPMTDMADMSVMHHGFIDTLAQFGLGSMW